MSFLLKLIQAAQEAFWVLINCCQQEGEKWCLEDESSDDTCPQCSKDLVSC